MADEMVTERATRRPTRFPSIERQERTFLARRAAAVERLVLSGIARRHAEAWITAWVESTAGLTDFRAAADYWELGFEYAIEERRRGYHPPYSPD
jgi:hypothetical protein